jgi:antitoxin component YwqK of YwqJK toxin-antitoxin module
MYKYNSYHKIVVALLVVFWAVFHFSQRKGEGLYYDNGQVKQTGGTENALNEGLWVWFYEDGSVQMKGEFRNGNREGIWKRFDDSGTLVSESTYLRNKLHGEYREFDQSGNVILTRRYENDVPLK